MMAAHLLRREPGRPNALSRAIEAALGWLERGYERALAILLLHRWKTLAVAVALLAATVAMAPLLKFSFLPKEDQAGVLVKVDLPEGASLQATERQVADLAAQLRAWPGVLSLYTSAGGGSQQKVSSGELQVNLVPIGERTFSQQELQERMRAGLVRPPDVKLSVQDFSNIGGGGNNQTVQFNLRGADYAALIKASDEVTRAMKAHGGFVDVDSTWRGGKPQVEVRLDRERAASLGVQAGVVAQTLRAYLGGDKVSWYREGTDSFEVRLALPDAVRADPAALGGLQIRGAGGQLVELRNVARLDDGEGPSQIDRQSRQRQITVLANLQSYSLGEAMTFLQGYAATKLPAGVSADFDGDAKRLGETGAAFGTALLLGLILVYIILAAQFESLVDPFTIMLSLPFAVIGAIASMLLARQQLTIFAMIGVIMLMGLVTKNGILLVEFARQLKEEGRDTFQALVEAGRVRLRPILMTTVAMIAGMVPVALAKGEGAETRVPMAIVIIGGLISSTVLTLGVVPVVYSLLDGARVRLKRRGARPEPVSAPASAA